MVVDVFSKYGWVVPLKFKTGVAVRDALDQIFKEHKCKKLLCDKGTEFYNKEVKKLLKSLNITIYSTENEEKCSVVERWNLTIKSKLWRYFTANNTHRYIDILGALITKYNNTRHRSVRMTPIEARKPENHDRVFRNLYTKKMKELGDQKAKFKVGAKVRLAVQKDRFEKSYIINWSDKIYTIKQVLATRPITYIVKNEKGEVHKGKFYEQELQKNKTDKHRIQKILKYKTEKGKELALVRWMEHGPSEDSWVPVEELE